MRYLWGILLVAMGLGAVSGNRHRTRQTTVVDRLLFRGRPDGGLPHRFVQLWGRGVAITIGLAMAVCGLLVLIGVITPQQ